MMAPFSFHFHPFPLRGRWRAKRAGWGYRQAPIDGYIVDFAELGRRLIIEVDGSQHGFEKGEASDRGRDQHFSEAGFRILRFWNHEVDQSMDGVIDNIPAAAPPSGASRHLPRKGEG
jgi:very-short-patch-repair endonuclease